MSSTCVIILQRCDFGCGRDESIIACPLFARCEFLAVSASDCEVAGSVSRGAGVVAHTLCLSCIL